MHFATKCLWKYFRWHCVNSSAITNQMPGPWKFSLYLSYGNVVTATNFKNKCKIIHTKQKQSTIKPKFLLQLSRNFFVRVLFFITLYLWHLCSVMQFFNSKRISDGENIVWISHRSPFGRIKIPFSILSCIIFVGHVLLNGCSRSFRIKLGQIRIIKVLKMRKTANMMQFSMERCELQWVLDNANVDYLMLFL